MFTSPYEALLIFLFKKGVFLRTFMKIHEYFLTSLNLHAKAVCISAQKRVIYDFVVRIRSFPTHFRHG